MLSNLTIALLLIAAEMLLLSFIFVFLHGRAHRWLVAARRRYHHGHGQPLPAELIDLPKMARELVESRQKLQAGLEAEQPPQLKRLMEAELEQIGHFSRHVVAGQTFDTEACRLSLAAVNDLMEMAQLAAAVTPPEPPAADEPATIEAKLAGLRKLAEAGQPVVLSRPKPEGSTSMTTDDAINQLADQLLAAQRRQEPDAGDAADPSEQMRLLSDDL